MRTSVTRLWKICCQRPRRLTGASPALLLLSSAVALASLLVSGLAAPVQSATDDLWSDVPESSIPLDGERVIVPDRYRTVALDLPGLRKLLAQAPLEFTPPAMTGNPLVLNLPLPGGEFGRFAIVNSPVMAPELAAKFPEIVTFAGRGLDDRTATARLDITPAGFHGLVISAEGTYYIDPHHRGNTSYYISYDKRDNLRGKIGEGCQVFDELGWRSQLDAILASGFLPPSGTELRTYRAAVATTGEYTAYHGGTVPAGLAAITTSMNRITGVYERDLSVRMQLVANNDLIIWTNAATDPYTNTNVVTMTGQNQTSLDAIIGDANYDIGHVCGTAGGGVAFLRVVCVTGQKARAATGLFPPVGDNFDIDYVAHEIGHQYGGNHSFNGNAGACSGGRVAGTAYEPGSGSTIMAYAGICGNQNLQPHSDDYFVWINILEIINFTFFGSGNNCPVITQTGAVTPIVDAGVGGFTIPMRTPFALTAAATTVGAPTYCWEESDLGPAGHPNIPTGNAPIFRSFDPVTSPTRTFPKLSELLNNAQVIGEILPTYARGLSFRVTVRDFQAGGVGVDSDNLAFSVSAAAGPFLVTAPNTAVVWPVGSVQSVTWDVSNTNVAPVNCANVNILLSTDGGVTFPITLATTTPNDGSESVSVPNNPTTTARAKVAAADNIFFDISNVNFEIQATSSVDDGREIATTSGRISLHENRPNPFNPTTAISFDLPAAADRVTLRVYDLSGRLVKTLVDEALAAGLHTAEWNGRDLAGAGVASGIYLYELRSGAESMSRRMILLK